MRHSSSSLFSLLRCPYCEATFEREQRGGFGFATCTCDRFPIVNGIFYCKKDDVLLHRQLVTLIEQKRYDRAVWVALSQHHVLHRVSTFILYVLREHGIKISERAFLFVLKLLGPSRNWFSYLLNANRHTLATATVAVQETITPASVVIDIGCGWGHLVAKLTEKSGRRPRQIIAIDKSFFSLLCAQLFHSHRTTLYVCSDVEAGIPVRDHGADQIVFLDAFMWIYGKNHIVRESHRALKTKGVLNIINVHVTTPETLSYGYGITSQHLRRLLHRLFTSPTFFSNWLNSDGQLQRVKTVDPEGYSCQTVKK
jgi:ubiquinone/menaquinone biosynthesis C-methylase UbiE